MNDSHRHTAEGKKPDTQMNTYCTIPSVYMEFKAGETSGEL